MLRSLKSKPRRLAFCSSTSGFAVTKASRIVRVNEDDENQSLIPLSQPCVLVALEARLSDHLLVLPFAEGSETQAAVYRIHCDSIDWDAEVTGLHWDSKLQLVFVAQPTIVTAMDLSGRVSAQSSTRSFGVEGPYHLCAIAGDADNIFLLDRNGPRLLVRNKRAALENLRVVSLSSELKPMLMGSDLGSLAVSGDSIFVSDNRIGRVFKLSGGSQGLIAHSASLGAPELCQIAADSSGHVIVSAFVSNSVTVLERDGTVLQTLTGAQNVPFHFPCGVAVLESAEGDSSLIVANFGNCGIYKIGLTIMDQTIYAGSGENRTTSFQRWG